MPDMRHAPPRRLRIADREGGMNQLSVRSHNERLLLSLLLQRHGLSRMEIGQITGLSAQTVSVIVRSLESDGLIVQGEAQRGRMGPPTYPLRVNPEGAWSIGISIGYRRTEVVLIDFLGTVRGHRAMSYRTSDLLDIYVRLPRLVQDLLDEVPADRRKRIAGIGMAVTSDIDHWKGALQLPSRNFIGIETEITQITGLEVLVQNDTTAATSAEGLFGATRQMDDYLYLFLGAHVRQRLVLNHQIHSGRIDLPGSGRQTGILDLESELLSRGLEIDGLWSGASDWLEFDAFLDPWLDKVTDSMRMLVHEAMQFVRFDTIVIAGSTPAHVLARLHDRLGRHLPETTILISEIDRSAKAVGAASLPFNSHFIV